jgi:hypothetical protein
MPAQPESLQLLSLSRSAWEKDICDRKLMIHPRQPLSNHYYGVLMQGMRRRRYKPPGRSWLGAPLSDIIQSQSEPVPWEGKKKAIHFNSSR